MGEKVIISKFQLFKEKVELEKVNLSKNYNLIYFDAFSPKSQPELWTTEIFKNFSKYDCKLLFSNIFE